jgi:hypothetical protein
MYAEKKYGLSSWESGLMMLPANFDLWSMYAPSEYMAQKHTTTTTLCSSLLCIIHHVLEVYVFDSELSASLAVARNPCSRWCIGRVVSSRESIELLTVGLEYDIPGRKGIALEGFGVFRAC